MASSAHSRCRYVVSIPTSAAVWAGRVSQVAERRALTSHHDAVLIGSVAEAGEPLAYGARARQQHLEVSEPGEVPLGLLVLLCRRREGTDRLVSGKIAHD